MKASPDPADRPTSEIDQPDNDTPDQSTPSNCLDSVPGQILFIVERTLQRGVIRAPKITLAKGERQRERIVTEEEFSLYIMACRQPWRDAAILIYCLGLRPSEVYTLRWEDISLIEAGFLQIVRGKSKAARRTLPLLVPIVQRALQARNREQGFPKDGWVFPTESKSGHLEQGSAKNQHEAAFAAIEKAAKEECKKAGRDESEAKHLKPFAPYCLRHTALTNLAPLCGTFTLKTIAGHSQISMTARYVHPQGEVIAEAFKKIAERQKVVIGASHSASLQKEAESCAKAVNN